MSFFKRVWGLVTSAGYRQPGLQIDAPPAPLSSEQEVDIDKALQVSSVFACVRLISETVSTLNPKVYQVTPSGGKMFLPEHPLNRILCGRANSFQTGQEFLELIVVQLCLQGNAYALKQRNSVGDLIGLVPLMPNQMEVTLLNNKRLRYMYTVGGKVSEYSQNEIWHIKLMGNGAIGLSPLEYARTTFGIGIAAEKTVAKLFANGAKPSGILTVDQILKPEQRETIRKQFQGVASGSDSNMFVLEANMKYQQISMTPEDIELLSNRKFQVEDIARFFGVPSVLINDLSATSVWGSGIHEIVQGWYKLGLRPYLQRLATSGKINLLSMDEQIDHEIIFDLDPLLQVGRSERYQTYREGITAGFLTVNEARQMEGLENKPGGDDLRIQAQMVNLDGGVAENEI